MRKESHLALEEGRNGYNICNGIGNLQTKDTRSWMRIVYQVVDMKKIPGHRCEEAYKRGSSR